jgi:hypothetical protein
MFSPPGRSPTDASFFDASPSVKADVDSLSNEIFHTPRETAMSRLESPSSVLTTGSATEERFKMEWVTFEYIQTCCSERTLQQILRYLGEMAVYPALEGSARKRLAELRQQYSPRDATGHDNEQSYEQDIISIPAVKPSFPLDVNENSTGGSSLDMMLLSPDPIFHLKSAPTVDYHRPSFSADLTTNKTLSSVESCNLDSQVKQLIERVTLLESTGKRANERIQTLKVDAELTAAKKKELQQALDLNEDSLSPDGGSSFDMLLSPHRFSDLTSAPTVDSHRPTLSADLITKKGLSLLEPNHFNLQVEQFIERVSQLESTEKRANERIRTLNVGVEMSAAKTKELQQALDAVGVENQQLQDVLNQERQSSGMKYRDTAKLNQIMSTTVRTLRDQLAENKTREGTIRRKYDALQLHLLSAQKSLEEVQKERDDMIKSLLQIKGQKGSKDVSIFWIQRLEVPSSSPWTNIISLNHKIALKWRSQETHC